MQYRVGSDWRPPELPAPYEWISWRDDLIDLFAEVNYLCFRCELDSEVFPCLGDREGCRRLLREIRRKPGFLPGATWLVAAPEGCVGTIQGIVEPGRIGSIQNVGVMPGYRGRGLGGLLVRQAIDGFARAGIPNVQLEVTAENHPAVRLYRNLGFDRIKTSYRAVPQTTS
jgi:GNAT superfamily N-acetyltransferase